MTKKNEDNKAGNKQVQHTDKINIELQARFGVKNVNYVIDNGIIKKGWMVQNADGLDEAMKLLRLQKAPIYILGEYAGAVIGWDMVRDEIVGSAWQKEKKKDEIKTDDFKKIKKKLDKWYKMANNKPKG